MRISVNDYNVLRDTVREYIEYYGPERIRRVHREYKDQGLSDKRFRWDIIWGIQEVKEPELQRVRDNVKAWFRKVYTYCYDQHIDTALRRVIKEVGV